jgi:hypothetical protein
VTIARRVALLASVVGWVYGWFLLRGVRYEYAVGDLGPAPPGLLLLLIFTTFVAIATAVSAGMKIRSWPYMAIGTAVLVAAGILLAQYFPLRDYYARHGGAPVTLGTVVTVVLRNRTSAGIVVATAVPMLLLLSGLSGLMFRRTPVRPVRIPTTRPPTTGSAT